MLPVFAKPIVDARARGERPELPVFVALGQLGVQRLYPGNGCTIVPADVPVSRLEFEWCVGLDIEVVAEHLVGNERAGQLIESVGRQRPRNLVAWETSTGQRWWLIDVVGVSSPAWRMSEWDPSLMPQEEARHAARA